MKFFYWLSWIVSRFTFSIVFRGTMIGNENLPKTGGFILASNHKAYVDPPFLGCCVYREMNYMAKDTLFRNKLLSWVISHVNARPVKRGGFDRKAMDVTIAVIKSGGGVVIFPEGTRSMTDDFLAPRPGVGKIAIEAQCMIVPAYIHSSNSLWHSLIGKEKLIITCAKPLTAEWVSQFSADKESYYKISEKIMEEIAKLKAEVLEKIK